MPDPVVTQVDLGCLLMGGEQFRPETLTFAAADDYVEGTILGRRSVATAITPAAGSNTGTGTCTAAAVIGGPDVPIAGNWLLTCIEAVANGGVFKLTDPNGVIRGAYLAMTAGAGAATVFKVAGLTFTLTDAATDFAVGDTFTLPVVAVGKLVPYSPSEKGGAQIPIAVLTEDTSKAAGGDVSIRALVAGLVNKNRLVIDDASTITDAILDQLRDVGIVPQDVTQTAALDNL